MKRKFLTTLFLAAITTLCLSMGFACGGGGLTISKTELSLSYYDSIKLEVSGAEESVVWTSSDETVVKVDADGTVIAQGKVGTATVTATSGGKSAACAVKTTVSRRKPALEIDDARAFVNCLSDPIIRVRYQDDYFTPDIFSVVSKNTSVLQIENNKLKGVALGTAEIEITAIWKNYEFDVETATVTVNPEHIMFLPTETPVIYDVTDQTTAKSNSYKVAAEVYAGGVLLNNPTLQVVATDNAEYVAINGSTVKVAKSPDADGVTVGLSVTYNGGEEPLTQTMSVLVMPKYKIMNMAEELVDTDKADIELKVHDGEISGRSGLMSYCIPDVEKNRHATAKGWVNWETRLEFVSTKTFYGISAYDDIKERGYEYISFDIYYTGTYGMFFGTYGCSSYFYVDSQNNRDDMFIVEDGVVTNTLKQNTWQTVYLNLDKLITAALIAGKTDCNMFLSCNELNDLCYIADVRYWYDTSVIDEMEKTIDLEERELTVDGENSAKALAPVNEFIEYSPVYVSYEQTQIDGFNCYKYDNTNAGTIDLVRRSKITPWNVLNGLALKKGYNYITFDIKVESGKPFIKYYDLYAKREITVNLTDGAVVSTLGIKLYKDGYETETFSHNAWMSVSVRIDGKAKESFYISTDKTADGVSIFYIKNTAYYVDDSYKYDLGYNCLLQAIAFRVDVAYTEQHFEVRDLLDVYYAGNPTTDYEIQSVTFSNSNATYDNGVISTVSTGVTTATVTVVKDTHTDVAEFEINIIPDNLVIVSPTEAELYCGSSDLFDKTLKVDVLAYDNRVLVSGGRMSLSVVGDPIVTVDGMVITAVSVGRTTVRVSFERSDGSVYSEDIEITVFDTFRQRDGSEFVWGTNTNPTTSTYTAEAEEIGGRDGVYKFTSNGSWVDRIMIKESGHSLGGVNVDSFPFADATSAFNNLTAKNINYVSFDVYFTAGALIRIQTADSTGITDRRNDYQAGVIATNKQDNANIGLYYNGSRIKGTVQANTWYTVVIDHKTAVIGNNSWTAMQICGSGTTYFDNVKYYHDGSWLLDFDTANVLTVESDSIKSEHSIGQTISLDLTVKYLFETVSAEDYQVTVTSTDESVAEYYNGQITFHKEGSVTLTVSVAVYGKTAQKVISVSVKKANRIEMAETTYTLWDESVITGDEFPSSVTVDADVYVNNVAVASPTFTMEKVSGDDIVVLENGLTLKAIAQGNAIIRLISVDNSELYTEITVTVNGRFVQKDGSEIVYTTTDGAVGDYGLYSGTVGGRTGVYVYASTAKEWEHKLNVKVGGHLNTADGPAKVKALREFVGNKYKYVTFDIYLTAGSSVMLSSLVPVSDYSNGQGGYPADTVAAGAAISEANAGINLYTFGETVTAATSDVWYTVVVDYSQIDADLYAQKAGVYSRIEIGGILGTVYLDNVRYYFNDSWKQDVAVSENYVRKDGSEFVKMAPWSDATGSYALETAAVNGRTGVYKYSSSVTNWSDKISIKESNHIGETSGSTPGTFDSVSKARYNMVGKNYNYVTFDVCLASGEIVINAPDSASAATSGQTYDKFNTASVTEGSSKINFYTVDAQGVFTEATTFTANAWYTVVVEYDGEATGTYAGIDIGCISANTVAYFDNVRYYCASPIAA